ncbi:hypothetical protein YC2023_002659 [Brassica napus]
MAANSQGGGMMRIGSITPEYAFDDEDSIDLACFHSTKLWMLAFLWIFKAFVETKTSTSSQPQPETIIEVSLSLLFLKSAFILYSLSGK